MPNDNDVREVDLSILTKDEILQIVRAHGLGDTPGRRKSKRDFIRDELSLISEDCRSELLAAAERKAKSHEEARIAGKKRKRETSKIWQEQQRQHAIGSQNLFLELPSSEQLQDCHAAFLNETSNAALKSEVCAACARRLGASSGERLHLDHLPNPHHLIPSVPHFAHTLTHGMLLVTDYLGHQEDGSIDGWFCTDCIRALTANKLPAFSLANRMWIGPIPVELSELTVPERALLSKYHPRCYVYKLYPRDLWIPNLDRSNLQTALVGNVTTYALNLPDVVKMISGKFLPRPAAILPATIAVTMVGPGDIPPNWLKRTFRVRRAAVLAAILCLKHQTRHPAYQDIDVSDDLLSQLPEDEVPLEILGTIRHEPDTQEAQREAESYLRNEDGTETDTISNPIPPVNANQTVNIANANEHSAPDVIPLQNLGAVETDLANVSTEELMMQSLANIRGSPTQEGGYAVRHGRTAVNEFGRPKNHEGSESNVPEPGNLSADTFFWLYPYGEGGIEADRPVQVSMAEHVRCNIQEHSRRFCFDPTWAFVQFSILQKRQALLGARLQVRRRDFDRATALFSTLTLEDLSKAAEETIQGKPPSDPKVALLRRMVHSAGGKVMGSDSSRVAYRSEISSTSLSLGPPSLWITMNPSDTHDPIVQVFAGEEVDMDNFVSTVGPGIEQRAQNVARNPYAAAHYFQFLITTILETLFGIRIRNGRVISDMGIFGYLNGYYGVVEAQGRGSLHVHMLVWLKDTPSADDMQTLLGTEEFKQKLIKYVDANIRAHLDPLTEETLKSRPREADLAWSRPPNPSSPDYQNEFRDLEERLARSQQLHKCKGTTCLTVFDPKTKTYRCKRKAPFPLHQETIILESGEVLPKRTHPFLNAWNPTILVLNRCNNDIKFLTNGGATRAIRWYITTYQTKKQKKSHNESALFAKHLAYHFDSSNRLDDAREQNRLLIFRCIHVLNRYMEQSGQQVFSYLMGYGDRFRSHTYVPVYLSAVIACLCKAFPRLRKTRAPQIVEVELSEADHTRGDKASDEVGRLDVTSSGDIIYRSQVVDYALRGPELEDWDFWTFVSDTRESTITSRDNEMLPEEDGERLPRPGRPRNERSRYLESHPKADTHLRIIRTAGHNVLPNIVGPWIPRNDRPESYDLYCATMLALLRPWRELQDLWREGESWKSSFDLFVASASQRQLDFISAAQYHYECKDAADSHRAAEHGFNIATEDLEEEGGDSNDNDDRREQALASYGPITDGMIEAYKNALISKKEREYFTRAITIGRLVGILPDNGGAPWISPETIPARLTNERAILCQQWQTALAANALDLRDREGNTTVNPVADVGSVVVQPPHQLAPRNELGGVNTISSPQSALQPFDVSYLKADQLRAFEIVSKHLTETLAGRHPLQLLMQIQGEGGTGKSTVIKCITRLFNSKNQSSMLQKAAYTGIAASVVDGSTLHTLCHMPARGNSVNEFSDKTVRDLRKTWGNVSYLIIDEISMIARDFLAIISKNLQTAKAEKDPSKASEAFGGVNVLITGDFHQFPPVARSLSAALFMPNEGGDSRELKSGRTLYKSFQTVIILHEQCRTQDSTYLNVLQHIRNGTCTQEDIDLILGLVLAPPGSKDSSEPAPNEIGEEWDDAVLVTPRNTCREAWNAAANRKICAKNGTRLYLCPAEDVIEGRPVTPEEKWEALQLKRGNKKDRYGGSNKLPDQVELAVGMEVMVTTNIETELDIANGARGKVVEIILDTREDMISEDAPCEVKLKYPPECVLVKLYRTKASQLPGLEKGVIPIFSIGQPFDIPREKKIVKAKRRQLPLVSAYAFTDYRSQGQTIPRVIVDIGRPPGPQKLSAFNIYVALSRSSGRKTIRLLREPDVDLLRQAPCAELLAEDRRLAWLEEKTKKMWAESGDIFGLGRIEDGPEWDELRGCLVKERAAVL